MALLPSQVNWSALPLFPLGQVLFPKGQLSLRVFEVRYLDMITQAHKNQTPFGVVTLKSGTEVRQPPVVDGKKTVAETFFDVGTLATIVQVETPQPGLLHVQCEGLERFHIMSSHQQKGGLWVADTFAFGVDPKVDLPSDLVLVAGALKSVIAKLQAKLGPAGQMPIAPPYYFDDCGWVANRWCELMRLPTELRQRLMQLDNPLMRLELVGDLLQRQGLLPK